MRGNNIHVKSREAPHLPPADFKISLLLPESLELKGLNFRIWDFILSRFDTKQWDCKIKYSHKTWNLRYNILTMVRIIPYYKVHPFLVI